jgi:hypothetical protein
MLTIPDVFSAGLWILGLAGVLATISYHFWYGSLGARRWGEMVTLPRFLSPFCISFALFCTGMALGAITNRTPSWWQLAAWSILAFIFAVFAARMTLAGRRSGWDTPIEEIKQP